MKIESLKSQSLQQLLTDMWPSPLFQIAVCQKPTTHKILHPAEQPLIRGASKKRQQDFCMGRYCAHQVLSEFGYVDVPILADQCGAPIWPSDIAGSISHSDGLAIAVATQKQHIKALGFDVQAHRETFRFNTLEALFSPAEKEEILLMPRKFRSLYAYGYFSAKESVLKCLYNAYGHLFELSEISIQINWEQGDFCASVPQNSHVSFLPRNTNCIGKVIADHSFVYAGAYQSEVSSKF